MEHSPRSLEKMDFLIKTRSVFDNAIESDAERLTVVCEVFVSVL